MYGPSLRKPNRLIFNGVFFNELNGLIDKCTMNFCKKANYILCGFEIH